MRCTTVRRMMIETPDAEQSALAAHLVVCEGCRREQAKIRRLVLALEGLGGEVSVPAGLETAVLRRVRSADGASPSWAARLRGWTSTPMLAAGAAVAALLIVVLAGERGGPPAGPEVVARPRAVEMPVRLAGAATEGAAAVPPGEAAGGAEEAAPIRVASGPAAPPAEPPADLAASLPMLLDLPILRNMEKLENYDRIEALSLVDQPEAPGPGTSG
jgi:cell division septation protein DedD